MDLGNLIGTLGGQYINARYGNNQAGLGHSGIIPTQPVFLGDAWSALTGGGDPTAAPTTGARGMVWDPNANCGQGKWVRRNRRRRRRLATPTDIKDLSALKGVLGSGEAFKTWIATHSN